MRVGNGFDIHRMEEGIPLILAGVEIPHPKGPRGHSDGDVVTHAIIDSLLGAAALGDIGVHFPPTDNAIKGIDSMMMLSKVLGLLTENGYTLNNIDTTIICETPKLSPHYDAMRKRLSEVLQIDLQYISLKSKTMEQLGTIGEGNAIAAYAVSLVTKKGEVR